MLCDRCHEREAHVRITKIVNGTAETQNLCEVCAAQFRTESDPDAAEWSKAIFKLLTEAVKQMNTKANAPENERLKQMTCPNCGRTYGEFLENGIFGCADCYEAFEPSLSSAVISLQGADTHTGKKAAKTVKKAVKKPSDPVNEKLSPEEETEILQAKLDEAVSIEDYASAAKYRDELNALKEKCHG